MTLSTAKKIAIEAHAGQTRADGLEPYHNHVIRVAERAEALGAPEWAVKAAFLHDVVEDTHWTIEDVREHMGDVVAEAVRLLTDPKQGPRKKRKAEVVRKLKDAPVEVKLVKLCDIEDNAHTMPEAKPGYAHKWASEKLVLVDAIKDGHLDLAETVSQTLSDML